YSTNVRLKKRIYVPPTVNSLEFAKMANVASENFSGETIFSKGQLDKIRAYLNGDIKKQTQPNPNNPDNWLGVGQGTSNDWYTGYANTNWFDLLYKDMEITQKHNISISGGSENMTYYLSGGFLKDPGQFKYGDKNEYYNRYNLNSNISVDITDWLKISNITRYYREQNSFPASLDRGTRGRYYHDIMRFAPVVPYKTPAVKDEQGNIIAPEQTLWLAGWLQKNGFNRYKINNFVTTLKGDIDVNNHLSFKGDFTFKKRFYHRTLNYKKWAVIGPTGKKVLVSQKVNNQIRKDIRK